MKSKIIAVCLISILSGLPREASSSENAALDKTKKQKEIKLSGSTVKGEKINMIDIPIIVKKRAELENKLKIIELKKDIANSVKVKNCTDCFQK